MNTELDVLAEGFIELSKVVLVLSDLADEVKGLLHKVLTNNLEDLVLLEGLTRDVEGEILRVDDTLDEVEVLRDEVLAVVHDEDAADVKLDVITLLLGLEKVEGSTLGNEKNCLEFELTLYREVLDGKMVFPVVGQALVERAVFFGSDVRGVSSPDGLGLVELLVRRFSLLDFLCLLLLLLFVLVNLLDLGIISVLLLLVVFDLFFNLFGDSELDGVGDEFRVLLEVSLIFFSSRYSS
jgi:hypothetical protein